MGKAHQDVPIFLSTRFDGRRRRPLPILLINHFSCEMAAEVMCGRYNSVFILTKNNIKDIQSNHHVCMCLAK